MRDLQHIQTHFQQFILGGPSKIDQDIVPTETVTTAERLDIYREGYYLRILEALQQDYAVLSILLGEEQFNQLGYRYIQKYPSHFRSLRWYGKELAEFMREEQDDQAPGYLVEMAEFEWLLTEAFDEREAPIVTLEEMAAVPLEEWATIRFSLHPSLRQINLEWNVPMIWKSSDQLPNASLPERGDQPLPWAIWRKEHEVHFCSLSDDEFYMLNAMKAGEPFEVICEGLCQWAPEEKVAVHAATLLKRYILDHLIIEIHTHADTP